MLRENIQEDIKHIKNIINGDKQSESTFYEKYKKILYNYVRRNFNDGNVDDHVSEILIKIFNSLEKYNPKRGGVKTWVFTIAKNYMLDICKSSHYNNNKNTTNIDDFNEDCVNYSNYILNDYISTNSSEINQFFDNSDVNYVRTKIDCNDYVMLNLHYGHGYTYSEIGDELNMTSNTVSNRVNYIRTKLKNEYECSFT